MRPQDEPAPETPAADSGADVAAPPALPVRATLYLLPDGRVQFGALFEELVPVARALDPEALPDGVPKAPDPAPEPS